MSRHFECQFLVDLPIMDKQSNNRVYFSIATIDFDPGLNVGDLIRVNAARFTNSYEPHTRERRQGQGPTFDFMAKIIKREMILEPSTNKLSEVIDILNLALTLEIADKEQIPEIVLYLTTTFPDNYRNPT